MSNDVSRPIQAPDREHPLVLATLNDAMRWLLYSLAVPLLLFVIIATRWQAPRFMLWSMAMASLFPFVGVFYHILSCKAMLSPSDTKPPLPLEPTVEEQIAVQEKQAQLLQKKIKKAEAEKEVLKKEIELAELENHLKTLKSGKPPDADSQKLLSDFEQRAQKIKDAGKVIELAEEEIRQHPHLEEYYRAIIDRIRKRLLGDE